MKVRAGVAIVVAAAGLAGGCGGGGGGGSRLSKSEYEQRMQAEASRLKSSFQSIGLGTSGNQKQLATKVARLQTVLDRSAGDVDRLQAPKDAEKDTKEIARALHRFAAIFGDLKRPATLRDPTKVQAAQQKLQEAGRRAQAATNDLRAKGYRLGSFSGTG